MRRFVTCERMRKVNDHSKDVKQQMRRWQADGFRLMRGAKQGVGAVIHKMRGRMRGNGCFFGALQKLRTERKKEYHERDANALAA